MVYAYQETSEKRIIQFLKWFQNTFCLRDWNIDLYYGPYKPDWVHELLEDRAGVILPEPNFFRAKLWLNTKVLEASNEHPLQVAAHEMVHALLSKIESQIDDIDDHPVVNRLEYPLTTLFFLDKGLKLPPVQKFGV